MISKDYADALMFWVFFGIVGVIAVAGWILYGGYHLIAWLIQHVRFV